nr:MAG TPA: hypothetical protein [Caudoviricetes sp.]
MSSPRRFRVERLMMFPTLHNTVSHAVKRREAGLSTNR